MYIGAKRKIGYFQVAIVWSGLGLAKFRLRRIYNRVGRPLTPVKERKNFTVNHFSWKLTLQMIGEVLVLLTKISIQ